MYNLSKLASVRYAKPDATVARATISYLDAAHDLITRGFASAVATAPITKEALKKVGFAYPGHTEYFAALTGTTDFAMMLAGSRLRVVLATIHVPLIDVFKLLTTELIVAKGMLIDRWFTRHLGLKPRIGIPGLNPHASENGLFGDEERRIIVPAVAALKAAGVNAEGPFPPDTIYHAAYHGKFDVILSMYHDQGLIPMKLVHFEDGINVTLGLPYVRSSVDHGSGYDIAGKGVANPASMIEAIRFAARVRNK